MEELNENIKKLTESIIDLTEVVEQLNFKQESIIDLHAGFSDQISGLTSALKKLAGKIN